MAGKGTSVCVTGASGFIACYVIKELLDRGYDVRGTVRDATNPKKTEYIQRLAEGTPGTLKLFSADLTKEGSFDEAVAGCHYVCHVASPVILKCRDPQKEVVEPAIQGTLNVLRAVQKAGTAARVVVTSSSAAMLIGDPKGPGHVYSEADWNEVIDARTAGYPTSKTLAEKAAWEFYEEQKKAGDGYSFELVTVLPGMALGPVLTRQHLQTSPQVVQQLLDGSFPVAPDLELEIVDVRDLAVAHVEALERPTASGRYLASGEHITVLEAANVLRPKYGAKYKLPRRVAPNWLCYLIAMFHPQVDGHFMRRQLGVRTVFSTEKAERELGFKSRPVAQSLEDTAASIISLGFV